MSGNGNDRFKKDLEDKLAAQGKKGFGGKALTVQGQNARDSMFVQDPITKRMSINLAEVHRLRNGDTLTREEKVRLGIILTLAQGVKDYSSTLGKGVDMVLSASSAKKMAQFVGQRKELNLSKNVARKVNVDEEVLGKSEAVKRARDDEARVDELKSVLESIAEEGDEKDKELMKKIHKGNILGSIYESLSKAADKTNKFLGNVWKGAVDAANAAVAERTKKTSPSATPKKPKSKELEDRVGIIKPKNLTGHDSTKLISLKKAKKREEEKEQKPKFVRGPAPKLPPKNSQRTPPPLPAGFGKKNKPPTKG